MIQQESKTLSLRGYFASYIHCSTMHNSQIMELHKCLNRWLNTPFAYTQWSTAIQRRRNIVLYRSEYERDGTVGICLASAKPGFDNWHSMWSPSTTRSDPWKQSQEYALGIARCTQNKKKQHLLSHNECILMWLC